MKNNKLPTLSPPKFYKKQMKSKSHRLQQLEQALKINFEDRIHIKNKDGELEPILSLDEMKELERLATEELEPLPQTGIPGISYRRDNNNYRVRMYVDGKRKCFGAYDTIEEAVKVWATVKAYNNLLESLNG